MTNSTKSPLRYLVQTPNAVLEVLLGARCELVIPENKIAMKRVPEYAQYCRAEAVIVGRTSIDEEGLNNLSIRFTTGPHEGRVINNVDPAHLHFIGVFTQVDAVPRPVSGAQ